MSEILLGLLFALFTYVCMYFSYKLGVSVERDRARELTRLAVFLFSSLNRRPVGEIMTVEMDRYEISPGDFYYSATIDEEVLTGDPAR